MNYKPHINCRVCGSPLIEYLDLGFLPLSNNLLTKPYESPERFPLRVMLCPECGLSQLSIVVDRELLFGHYVYRSSINKGYVEHCREMAKQMKIKYGLNENSFMVDIAGNDGALLREFRDEIGLEVLNVDPAENLTSICHATGIASLSYFWGTETARRILNGFGRADLITATNVFAHVDDVYDFMEGVKALLKPGGVLILEFPYLVDFIENNEFDTIYFEHLSYFGIRPLLRICDKVRLSVTEIERISIHGGSVRVHIGHGELSPSANRFIMENEFRLNFDDYLKFAENAKKTISNFRTQINSLVSSGKLIAGFAASAKGNTLLNCAGITVGSVRYIVDETPEKIGKYYPGTFIPIVAMMDMVKNPPDYLIVLSWNFKEEIMAKCRAQGYEGKFIIPIPEFKVLP